MALRPDNLDDRLELSYALSNLGSLARQQGRLGEAVGTFAQTLAVQQDLVARDPGQLDWQFELAATHDLLGSTLLAQGRSGEALPHLEAQSRLLQGLVERAPDNFRYREFLGISHDSLEAWFEARGRLAEALRHAEAAGEVFAPLVARDSGNQIWRWQLGLARVKRAHLLSLAGQSEEGRSESRALEALASEARFAAQRMAGDPADRKWRLLAGTAEVHLGEILAGRGRLDEARRHARSALASLGAPAGIADLPGPPPAGKAAADPEALQWRARALLLLGQAERGSGDPRAATAAWQEAERALAMAAPDHAPAALAATRACLLLLLARPAEARPLLRDLAATATASPCCSTGSS